MIMMVALEHNENGIFEENRRLSIFNLLIKVSANKLAKVVQTYDRWDVTHQEQLTACAVQCTYIVLLSRKMLD